MQCAVDEDGLDMDKEPSPGWGLGEVENQTVPIRDFENSGRRRYPSRAACLLGKARYDCGMDCVECEDLKRRSADATIRYVEADKRRKSYIPDEPLSSRDITEIARLDQEVENTMRKRNDLDREYARHRRAKHPRAPGTAGGHSL
jgi:hypothetical protein